MCDVAVISQESSGRTTHPYVLHRTNKKGYIIHKIQKSSPRSKYKIAASEVNNSSYSSDINLHQF